MSLCLRYIKDGELDGEFTDAEIEEGIKALDYHKAQAEDGTTNPMYKCGGEEMRRHLRKFFNYLRVREAIPNEWQRSLVVNLYKEGDKADPGNYRGIALISCLGKVYLSLWARRLAAHAETRLKDGQGGFRSRRSTVDQALTLHEVLLRRKLAKKNSYCCFIDFRKAFDTVWSDGLWKRLWDEGVHGKAIGGSFDRSMPPSARESRLATRRPARCGCGREYGKAARSPPSCLTTSSTNWPRTWASLATG